MARSPLLLDAHEVIQRAGVRHIYHIDAPLPGARLSTAEIPEDEAVVVDVVLEARGTDIIVEGTTTATWRGECRRCLEPTSGHLQLELREIYSENPVEGETFPFDGERLDLAPMLREAFTLALPLLPLCRDDCPGPDPDHHPVATDDVPSDDPSTEDDPWAALDQLRFER